MRKRLAIKGHLTRGKEVIELLEMMGGKNNCNSTGDNLGLCYLIDDETDIVRQSVGYVDYEDDGLNIFTLEEFWEKFPFKIGDKVIDTADGCPGVVSEMKWDEDVSDMKYFVAFGNGIDFGWYANDSIEFCKENENLEKTQPKRDIDKADFMIKHMILPNKMDDKLEYEIIDGYEFDKVDNNKIILKPIKPKYPTTYKECCDVLSIAPYYNLRYHTYEHCYGEFATSNELLSLQDKLNILGKLIICRNAYWKIASEVMGLGKPWEPDWTNLDQLKYCIWVDVGEIITMINVRGQHILAFPTEEMRDIFYNNFKDLIEQCKELL